MLSAQPARGTLHPHPLTAMAAPYPPPVDLLLALGEEPARQHPWPDYLELGPTAEHVPELVRMAADPALEEADSESAEVWAPVHARRTLGQLRADESVPALLRLLLAADEKDDDWGSEEIPKILGMIGPAALEPVRAALPEASRHPRPWTSAALGSALAQLAAWHPETRGEAVAALHRQLEGWPRQTPGTNAFLISSLLELRATEAAATIEEAFAGDAVDVSMVGDWEDAQVELGLLPRRVTPRPRAFFTGPREPRPAPPPPAAKKGGNAAAKKKRKAEKAARKRNRRKG